MITVCHHLFNSLNIVEIKKIIEFQRLLLRWGRKNIRNYRWRRKSASNYEKVVIEILLQRTKSETVSQFAPGFLRCYPSWKKLAEARPRDIEKVLKPIGLSKQRAPRLVSLAKAIVDNGGRIPHQRKELEKLPGVGQYIANSIGFTMAATNNYYLNRLWTFKSTNPKMVKEYIVFLIISIFGLILNNLIIWLLNDYLFNFNFYLAKLFAIGIVFIWNFTMNNFFNFKIS